jgi:hypothetical protein
VNLGRWIAALGLVLVGAGLLIMAAEKLGLRLGRLPGDIVYRRKNFAFYFPLGTCLLLSVILTLVLWLLRRPPR